MALSKEFIRPYAPKDFSTMLLEKKSVDGADFTPGTLVAEVNNLIVACDTDVAQHETAPAFMVWTDGSTRVDTVYEQLDGTLLQLHTCIGGQFKADCNVSLFTATPVAGDVIAKSATAGKLDPLDSAELATLLASPEDETHIVGRVNGSARRAELSTDWFDCHFDLG